MRGSHERRCFPDGRAGIIPAGAGLTSFWRRRDEPHRDHPRGCGAHVDIFNLSDAEKGSSPRVRGSRLHRWRPCSDAGIIPAGAGLTPADPTVGVGRRDHPRGCGAHCADLCPRDCPQGSSPRVRGSPSGVRVAERVRGIIPAGAGLTLAAYFASSSAWDHPRGCGAHLDSARH